MTSQGPEFKAPIIEAVVDIDCDLPPNLDLWELREGAGEALRERYPKFRQQFVQQHLVSKEDEGAKPRIKVSEGPGAMQFLAEDELQLVQFRPNGFSFNRLAPYSSLDDYLPEIEAAWSDFCELSQPVLIRKIGIRMINRVRLPLSEGRVNFEDYLQVPPRLPETGRPLGFLGFLEQHVAIDSETGNRANIVKTTEAPRDGYLPLILDIEAFWLCEEAPGDWTEILSRLKTLRDLKNRIFRTTLTGKCLNLFSQPAS
jgi:uncharacterized protein (TIGR04255 family)